MPQYIPEPDYQHGNARKIGVLLVNLGTPDAPDAPSLRRYLKQFLSDPRVVEIPRVIWWLILNLIILNTRPAKSAAKYATVWRTDGGGSPLRYWTEQQAHGLAERLGNDGGEPVAVAWGMRYGNPSIESAVLSLRAQGCDRILLMPMYPQYAASTTASSFDALAATFRRLRSIFSGPRSTAPTMNIATIRAGRKFPSGSPGRPSRNATGRPAQTGSPLNKRKRPRYVWMTRP